jgi:four helix bundle protein
MNKEKGELKQPVEIRARAFNYALRAIRLYQSLGRQKSGAAWILGKQYLRSATSIGANIEEAQSGESRSDFIHKYGVTQKEARERLYWLRLLAESGIVPQKRLIPLLQETEEIIAIITAIIVRAKGKSV